MPWNEVLKNIFSLCPKLRGMQNGFKEFNNKEMYEVCYIVNMHNLRLWFMLWLENWKAFLWWIFQTRKFFWETATLSITFPSFKCWIFLYIWDSCGSSSIWITVRPRYDWGSDPPLSTKVPICHIKVCRWDNTWHQSSKQILAYKLVDICNITH